MTGESYAEGDLSMKMMMKPSVKMGRMMMMPTTSAVVVVNAYWHPWTYLVMLLLAPRTGGGVMIPSGELVPLQQKQR